MAFKTALFLFVAAFPAQFPAQELTKEQEQAAAQAVAVLDEAVRGIPEIQELNPRIRAAISAAQTYARAGRRDQAILTVNQSLDSFPTVPDNGKFDPHRDRALVDAVGIFCNMRSPEVAEPLATSIHQESSRWFALSRVAGAYAFAGDHSAAQRTIAAIPEGRSRDSSFQMVAHACISKRDFACASASAEAIADPAMKAQTLAYLANRKAQHGAANAADDAAQAKALAEDLPESGRAQSTGHFRGCEPASRPTPRDAALHAVAESHVALRDDQGVRETLASIQDPYVRESALAIFSRALAYRRDFNAALAVAGEITRPQCRSTALSSLAYYQYRAGDAQAAQATMAGIPTVSDRVYALLSISHEQQRRGNEDFAPTLALAADLAMQAPDPLERLSVLLQVAHRQTALGLSEQLPHTLRAARALAGQGPPVRQNMGGRNWDGMVISIAELLAESGDLAGAEEVARLAQYEFPASAVARGAARGGHLARARAWVDSLPQAHRTFALIGIATGILDRARIGRTPASSR